jgi:predicted AlkP superfamily phosphohydrolase/phosphomutase
VLNIRGEKIKIRQGAYTNWVRLPFKLGFGKKVYGIGRFFPMSLDPEDMKLYLSPINIDPESPALPISSPYIYSIYLSRLIGPYATLGLAEDTWALNERVIDEDAFLKQCYLNHEEREQMFFHELRKIKKGVCCCVFDTTDRIQHMFWRYRDGESHPALRGLDPNSHAWVLEDLYKRMDSMIGKVLDMLDYNTLLMVISDHGFKSFQRGVNLNTWLYKNGYLALKEGATGKEDWLQAVDWSKTKAYTLGLSGIFLNIKGRESQGIVSPGKEAQKLKEELIQKLTGLKDMDRRENAITTVYDSASVHHGPYSQDGPELIIGYSPGYRASWEAATGMVTDSVCSDNIKSWSGDHCIDPEHVPGVFFSSRPPDKMDPKLIDIAPTLLWEFGLKIPPNMEGRPLFD